MANDDLARPHELQLAEPLRDPLRFVVVTLVVLDDLGRRLERHQRAEYAALSSSAIAARWERTSSGSTTSSPAPKPATSRANASGLWPRNSTSTRPSGPAGPIRTRVPNAARHRERISELAHACARTGAP